MSCRMKARRLASGFSLVELLITLAVLGIISAIVAPRYASSMERYRAGAAVRRVMADLVLAQSAARAASATRRVVFDVNNAEYVIEGVAAADALPGQPRGTSTRVHLGGEPYRAAIKTADFGGDDFVAFDGFGRPLQGGTVVVKAGGRHVTISVAAETGAVTSD
ncbi:MAG: Tfp pilus assembly protein FimT/FimU [Phycisphaerales bacterium]